MRLFIFIVSFVVILTILIVIISRKYQRELVRQDWYDDFQFEYESIDCPHEKTIKLKDTDWKFAFRTKKEKSFTVNIGGFSKTSYTFCFRLYCEACEQKRWFKQTNSIRHHKGLFGLRLKYLAIGGGTIMLTIFLGANLLALLFF